MSIPNKISFYRKKNGMTQDELASMLGVSRQFVSSIEGAKKIPSIKVDRDKKQEVDYED